MYYDNKEVRSTMTMSVIKVLTDEEAFEAIKPKNRKVYINNWMKFKSLFDDFNFEFAPTEDMVLSWVRNQREVEEIASSTLWNRYSLLNAIIKAKFGFDLKKYVRVTSQIKTFDVDVKKKAEIFEKEDLDKFIANSNLSTPFWLVRKAIAIFSFFGGLRKKECESLQIEKVSSSPSGLTVTHSRVKQRSDARETKFLILRRDSGLCYAT